MVRESPMMGSQPLVNWLLLTGYLVLTGPVDSWAVGNYLSDPLCNNLASSKESLLEKATIQQHPSQGQHGT